MHVQSAAATDFDATEDDDDEDEDDEKERRRECGGTRLKGGRAAG